MSTPRLTFAQRLASLPLIGGLLSLSPIRGRIAMLATAAVATLALVLASGPNSQLASLEERLGTVGWTLAPQTDTESRVVIVAIDEQSIVEVGPLPWTRETMA